MLGCLHHHVMVAVAFSSIQERRMARYGVPLESRMGYLPMTRFLTGYISADAGTSRSLANISYACTSRPPEPAEHF
jgi:hypothetical protein